MSKRNAMLRKLHQQVEQDTRMSQPLQVRGWRPGGRQPLRGTVCMNTRDMGAVAVAHAVIYNSSS